MKGEGKREKMHGSCLPRRWGRTKNAEVGSILGEKFQSDGEECSECESSEDSKHREIHVACCQEKNRQRKTVEGADRREMEEHKKNSERSTVQTDEDKDEEGTDCEHETCVISWNVNKSFAHYDFFRDMVQRQADVAMFQETRKLAC